MREIFRHLGQGARVLDLGARHGSFSASAHPGITYRLDLERPVLSRDATTVQGDAGCLPFRDHAFDAVIANHSLEHFQNLAGALREVGRVLKPDGALFVTVPDASTLTDRIYRFLAGGGGGHVNPFRSPEEVIAVTGRHTGLELRGVRTLFTSLSYLHPANLGQRRLTRIMRLLGLGERALTWTTWLLRWMDRKIGTRTSIYGWAFYFGTIHEPIDASPWTNVCVRCGAGHSTAALTAQGAIRQGTWLDRFRCLTCGTWSIHTDDVEFRGPTS